MGERRSVPLAERGREAVSGPRRGAILGPRFRALRPMPRLLRALLVSWLLAGVAAAQLDLPDAGGDRPARRRSGLPGLDLPQRAAPAPAPEPAPAPPSPRAQPAAEPSAADALLERARRATGLSRGEVVSLGRRLAELGPTGLAAARAALGSSDRPDEVVVAARALLIGGAQADRALVTARLSERLPGTSAGALVAALLELDPVAASPELFAGLLDHPQSSVRFAASQVLADRVSPALLPVLVPVLRSRRDDARLAALELCARVDAAEARELVLQRLADESPRVAARAAQLLARWPDDPAQPLLDLVQEGTYLSRAASYALLAIAQREDERGVALLGDEHVERLLANLTGGDELAKGAAACALAGIGFRRPRGDETAWLDLLVPHHLVRAIAAPVFHRDFASVVPVAERRLALVAGFSLGSDAKAWQGWWAEAAPTFRARRAVVRVAPEEADHLYLSLAAPGESFVLAGARSAVAPPADAELVFLTREECLDLLRALEREGALGGERLPIVAGPGAQRAGELAFGAREGSKRFGLDGAEPWLERLAAFARALRERNGWQRFLGGAARDERRAAWSALAGRWSEADARGRARLAADLALAALAGADGPRRGAALDELQRLTSRAGFALDASDVRPLSLALGDERPLARSDADRALDLALAAARADTAEPGARAVDRGLAEELALAAARRLGAGDPEPAARALAAAGPGLARVVAAREDPALRAAAALALALDPAPEAEELLRLLLRDDDAAVEAAAVTAVARRLGAARAARIDGTGGTAEADDERALARERLAGEIVARTASERPAVRRAALAAVPESGDRRAVGALLRGLSDSDPACRVAAAEAMADLRDPQTVPILITMLSGGPESDVFAAARRGLLALGARAHDELLVALRRGREGRSGPSETQREIALILSEGSAPEAVSPLLSILTADQDDARVAEELAVLTCVDLRDREDPAGAWWEWWDQVVHDDSLAWLCAAGGELGLPPPAPASFAAQGRGGLDRAAAQFLLDLACASPPEAAHVAERARRELERRLGEPLDLPREPDELERAVRLGRMLDEGWGE